MSATPTFTPQLIGRTEKALNALLYRQLEGSGVAEPQWVTLVLAVTNGGSLARAQLVELASDGMKIDRDVAQAHIDRLAELGMLEKSDDDEGAISVSDSGHQLFARVRGATAEITERMWGDLPADDLAVAGRVLSKILERATAELAS
jgi:DNA-binding MarR family transcriptional regulator